MIKNLFFCHWLTSFFENDHSLNFSKNAFSNVFEFVVVGLNFSHSMGPRDTAREMDICQHDSFDKVITASLGSITVAQFINTVKPRSIQDVCEKRCVIDLNEFNKLPASFVI